MTRLRFPLMLGIALASGAMAAHAQSAPAAETTPAPAKVEDIEVAHDGDSVSILVKFSGQPTAASAMIRGKDLTLDVDGFPLAPLRLTPPAGSLIASVTAANGQIVLSGAAFSDPDVVVYRRAVLLKVKLAEPATIGGASLMDDAATTLASPPLPVITALPKPAPTPPAPPKPEVIAAPAPVGLPTASLAGIDAARCETAAEELAKDNWALAAMGDHALCLIDQDKLDEARAKLDQLGAITPQDWRVSLGRAVLADKTDDTAEANANFLAASLGAPNDALRAAITARIKPEALTPAPIQSPD
ncbi:MAG: hypothetical protein R3C46_17095, partial [Hyphomonadaceae bacterium]